MGSARPAVSRPGWGREAPGGSGLSWREAPVTPEGGGHRGYHLAHISVSATHEILTKFSSLCFFAIVKSPNGRDQHVTDVFLNTRAR